MAAVEERHMSAGASASRPADGLTAGPQDGQVRAARSSQFIRAGDLIIIFMSRDKPPVPITVTPGQESTNAYGSFSHDSMVGLPFGAKLASRNARGFVHLLRPNPELWTLALPHRTQIVYTPDMSFIAAHLGLTPGAKVIEAGTGSGSFSHYLTRTVARNHAQSRGVGWKGKAAESRGQNQRNGRGRGRDRDDADGEEDGLKLNDSEEELSKKLPANKEEAETMRLLSREPDAHVDGKQGRVWSFEFHAGRAVKAWDEFQDHGLFPTLSLRHRNVCKNGFGLQGVADAVFLDLPAPWEALGHAAKALRSDVAGRICCFSPCIEQVLKTVEALRKRGDADEEARWVDIETYECLNRTHLSIWAGPTGQTGNSSIQEAITRIKHVEERKGRRREAQIARVKKERLERQMQDGKGEEAVDAAKEGDGAVDGSHEADDANPAIAGEKRKRDDGSAYREEEAKPAHVDAPTVLCKDGKTLQRANVYARPFTEMKGHTSYLTFATLLPRTVKTKDDSAPHPSKEDKTNDV